MALQNNRETWNAIADARGTSRDAPIAPSNTLDYTNAIFSLLSDVQEMIAFGDSADAITNLNGAKVMLSRLQDADRSERRVALAEASR
jgi:hypothetical protein